MAASRALVVSLPSARTPRIRPSRWAIASESNGSHTRAWTASPAVRVSSKVCSSPLCRRSPSLTPALLFSHRLFECQAQRLHRRRHLLAVRRLVGHPRYPYPRGARQRRSRVDPVRRKCHRLQRSAPPPNKVCVTSGYHRLPRHQVLQRHHRRLDRPPRRRRRPRTPRHPVRHRHGPPCLRRRYVSSPPPLFQDMTLTRACF